MHCTMLFLLVARAACADNQFACETTTTPLCVEADKVCDRVPTCPDGSDEADCGESVYFVTVIVTLLTIITTPCHN